MRNLVLFSAFAFSAASFAQVGVDGLLGSEWTGIVPNSVGYDPNAPLGNFGTPGSTNHTNSYDVYLRADQNYVYGLMLNTGGTPAFTGANVYFSSTFGSSISGGNIGFEITNNRAFRPQTGAFGTTSITGGGGSYATVANSGVEFALPWSIFTDNTLGVPDYVKLNSGGNDLLTMTLSQSFGYSVAGGASFGADRLGQISYSAAVPEPASMAALGLGLAAFRRRRASRG